MKLRVSKNELELIISGLGCCQEQSSECQTLITKLNRIRKKDERNPKAKRKRRDADQ